MVLPLPCGSGRAIARTPDGRPEDRGHPPVFQPAASVEQDNKEEKEVEKYTRTMLKMVSSAIEHGYDDVEFDLTKWGTMLSYDDTRSEVCETAGCIAGFVVALHDLERFKRIVGSGQTYNINTLARNLLGLTVEQAVRLFQPTMMHNVPKEHAAAYLRHVADDPQGEIDCHWPMRYKRPAGPERVSWLPRDQEYPYYQFKPWVEGLLEMPAHVKMHHYEYVSGPDGEYLRRLGTDWLGPDLRLFSTAEQYDSWRWSYEKEFLERD